MWGIHHRRSTLRTRRVATALLTTMLAVAIPAVAGAAAGDRPGNDVWQHVPGKPAEIKNGKKATVKAAKLRAFTVDRGKLAAALGKAPRESRADVRKAGAVVSLPAPDGGFERFALVESPVMEAGLAAKHPEITTYAGKGLDDPTATIRADLTPLGFHASVLSPRGVWYVDPVYHLDDSLYATYFVRDLDEGEEMELKDPVGEGTSPDAVAAALAEVPVGPAVKLRTYRLALLTDPSYTAYHGGPANVTAAKVTLMNRVNQIYEDETSIRLVLIADNDKLNFNTAADATGANGPCGAAPCFTPANLSSCTSAALQRNRIVIGQIIGASNYDIGHLALGNPGGGVASLNAVGGNAKAQGCTGLPTPIGDYFAVDYVAHEMGHQFGGNHTFNGNQHNCGGNKAAPSVEPGSGSSIMAYAGICRHDNLQPHSDPYWSQWSFQEITAFVTSNRAAINEVQTVSLREFDTNGDSFTLSYGGVETAPIVRGTNYTTAAIDAALEAVTGAGTITVAAWGGSGTLNDNGFQLTFTGALAATNVQSVVLNATDASGFVGETAKGGAVDNQGHVVFENGNNAPVVTVPMQFTIPVRTPFALTGSATDSNGDALTYMWEQKDRGGGTGTALTNNVKLNGPLFRQFGTAAIVSEADTLKTPSPGQNGVGTVPTRVFPDLGQILANNTNAVTGGCTPFTGVWPETVPAVLVDCYSEFLPTAAYLGVAGVNAAPASLNFRLTVRDHRPGGAGIGNADTRLVLAPTAGPFLVTSQAAGDSLRAGSTQEVTWDVANTDVAPVGTESVKISLSTDGGWTYPHVLAAATANDGSDSVVLPNVDTTTARIKVEAIGNVFFDISETDFSIRSAATQLNELIAYAATLPPGKSLERIARAATAQLAAGKVQDACDTLNALLNEVRAMSGKALTTAQAAEMTLRAKTIRTALGC